jgi:peptidyl-prolyl cis-trans isomerase D
MVLQSIRERLTGILAIVILGILVIPFAFVGVNSYFQSGAENLVARVNDTDITTTDFTQSFSNYRRRMQSIMGAAFDPEEFESLVSKREHLDSLIDEELLNQAAQGLDLAIDNARLAEQIRDMPAFQLDGQFSQEVYLARLASQGLSVQQFERQMKSQSVMSQMPTGVLASSISTGTELQEYVRLQDQKRSFKSILVAPVIDESIADPDEATIQAYYDENQNSFQSEEMVLLEYVELNATDIPAGTVPDEDFLMSRFEQQKGRFLSPEQRLVSHILVEVSASEDEAVKTTAQQAAQDIADRARAGEDFAVLAAELSDDIGSAAQGGDLGWLEPGIMSESFEDAMNELSLESPISDPVQTGFGWHVIQLREIQDSEGLSFEEAREILITEHHEEESEREFIEKADLLVDMIYEDPTTLDAAALDLGLDIQRVGPFSRSGGDGIAAIPEVINTAFSELVLLQGSVSDPIDLDDNHLVMIRVAEHFPVTVQELDVVRDQIMEQIKRENALAVAESKVQTMLAESSEEGADLDAIAVAHGYVVVESEAATRRDFVPDRTVIEEVFRLESPAAGETLSTVVPAQNGFALVILESVTEGSLEQGTAINEQQYRRQIANAAASIEITGLLRQLRDSSRVEVFEDRLR